MEKNNSTCAITRIKQPKSPSILSHPVVPDKRRTPDKKIILQAQKSYKTKKIASYLYTRAFQKGLAGFTGYFVNLL